MTKKNNWIKKSLLGSSTLPAGTAGSAQFPFTSMIQNQDSKTNQSSCGCCPSDVTECEK